MRGSGSGTRADWSQSWCVGLHPGLSGPSGPRGPRRVIEPANDENSDLRRSASFSVGTIEGHHPTYEEDSSRNGSTSPTRMFRVLIHAISYLRASAGRRSEIRCASMSSDIWSRECAGGWRAMARTPVGPCVRVHVLVVSPYGVRTLAVWPLDSRRMAWPHFTRSRLGLRSSRGRMVCNLPRSLPHTCSRPLVVPHVPSPPPGLR